MPQPKRGLSVVQLLPELNSGGVERGTLEVASALVKQGHRSIVISGGGRLVQRLIDGGSEHIQLQIGKKSPLSLRFIPQLRKYFQQQNINIIHARSRLPAWLTYLAWRSMDSNRPRFITTVHGAYSVNAYSKIMLRGENVIVPSKFITQYIADNYPDTPPDKITLIYRGVSADQFPYGYQPDKKWLQTWQEQNPRLVGKYILTLPGRISRRKGHEDLLKILSNLKQQYIPVHGLIVGNTSQGKGAYLAELKGKVRQLELQNEISFLGHRDDIREIMSISNIVLSLSNKPESFGRTSLEALCLGIPVVAYHHGGTAEILEKMYPHGDIEHNNITTACDKIKSLYQQPIAVIEENFFTLDKMLQQTLALYQQVSTKKTP